MVKKTSDEWIYFLFNHLLKGFLIASKIKNKTAINFHVQFLYEYIILNQFQRSSVNNERGNISVDTIDIKTIRNIMKNLY